MSDKPAYRSLKFWKTVSKLIDAPIHCLEFEVNTWDIHGNETGSWCRCLYGDTGEVTMQLSYGNRPKDVASTIITYYEKSES